MSRGFLIFAVVCALQISPQGADAGPDVLDVPPQGIRLDTAFSTIIVRDEGGRRVLYFERDSGEQVVESAMDLARPHHLLVGYTRSMFGSYLFVPDPTRVLIVGLGAGSMVRFLQYHEPAVAIDAVDIDPAVLSVADRYFGTRATPHVQLIAADGIDFIKNSTRLYDVIYMDAFLKPSAGTDSTGVPLPLKTVEFYQETQRKLAEGGVVVVNLNWHPKLKEDVTTIRQSFEDVRVLKVPGTGNLVVIGAASPLPTDLQELDAVARRVDKRFGGQFSVAPFIRAIEQPVRSR